MADHGRWISPDGSGWTFHGIRLAPSRTAADAREVAAELLAWADAHDTVTITITKATAERYACIDSTLEAAEWDVAQASRKALEVEP